MGVYSYKVQVFVVAGLFIITTGLLFAIFHIEQLVYREQLQLFQDNNFLEKLIVPGGLSIFAGEFFLQFFKLHIGALFVTVLFVTIIIIFLFRIFSFVTNKNTAIFFSLLPAAGYALLLLDRFFYFSGLVAFLLSIIGIDIYIREKRGWRKFILGLLLVVFTYWFAGGAVFTFSFSVFLLEIVSADSCSSFRGKLFFGVSYIVLSFLLPALLRNILFYENVLQSFVSEAFYRIPVFLPVELILALLSVPLLIFIAAFFESANISFPQRMVYFLSLFMIILFGGTFYCLNNTNEERIRKLDNLVFNKKWNEIAIHARKQGVPDSKEASVAVNLSLAKEGRLTTDFFKIQGLQPVFVIPYERKGMTPFMASEPYYYLGLNNFARMMAMETLESTVDAKLPVRAVKRISETFLISGNDKLAQKYLGLLSETMFYSTWAKRHLSQIRGNESKTEFLSQELNEIRSRLPDEDFYYNEKHFEVALLYLLRANKDNRMAYEYLMMHYLLNKNFDSFINFLSIYSLFKYEETPLIFQEAKAYIQTLTSDDVPLLDVVNISKNVEEKFNMYISEFRKGGNKRPERMKDLFGDTYWYYLHFGRNDS
ncbi:DUF6057 family protein [Anaerophaga thermohalophila]|uniref:DUF6057 family protein n=1 Tax=Anaerophaga thermohalophila TaxID=177400 RepID=UPI000237BE8F|nr:DUF6057 family protein [Anaerophaga thermohalophila]